MITTQKQLPEYAGISGAVIDDNSTEHYFSVGGADSGIEVCLLIQELIEVNRENTWTHWRVKGADYTDGVGDVSPCHLRSAIYQAKEKRMFDFYRVD